MTTELAWTDPVPCTAENRLSLQSLVYRYKQSLYFEILSQFSGSHQNSLWGDNKIFFINFLKTFLYNHDPEKLHIKENKELKILSLEERP